MTQRRGAPTATLDLDDDWAAQRRDVPRGNTRARALARGQTAYEVDDLELAALLSGGFRSAVDAALTRLGASRRSVVDALPPLARIEAEGLPRGARWADVTCTLAACTPKAGTASVGPAQEDRTSYLRPARR